MSAIDNHPENINFLSQNSFRFTVKRLPNINYFCQGATLPAISIGSINKPNPLAYIPTFGDRITYEPLVIRFRVDENLENYMEIQSWIEGMGHPESLKQVSELGARIRAEQGGYGKLNSTSFVSDGVLSILTSNKNVNKNVFFRDCFPVNLSELSFDSMNTTVEYLEATATFNYRRYEFEV